MARVTGSFLLSVWPDLGSCEPDGLNRTVLGINGQRAWPTRSDTVSPEIGEGDEVRIRIPSGELSGRVTKILPMTETGYHRGWEIPLVVEGAWEGKWAGLQCGACAIGHFEIFSPYGEGVTVESSCFRGAMPYNYYTAVRRLAEQILETLPYEDRPPQKMGEIMARICREFPPAPRYHDDIEEVEIEVDLN